MIAIEKEIQKYPFIIILLKEFNLENIFVGDLVNVLIEKEAFPQQPTKEGALKTIKFEDIVGGSDYFFDGTLSFD